MSRKTVPELDPIATASGLALSILVAITGVLLGFPAIAGLAGVLAGGYLAGRLARIPGLRAFPSAANFVLIRCERRPAAEVFRRLVEEHGILVRDVSGAVGLEGCLRITAGTDEDVDAVVRALQAILV